MRSLLLRPPPLRAPGLVLLVLITGCAYYNTFYLAKRHFREAERAHAKSPLGAPPAEAMTKYEAAIRQCTKLLTDYPKSKYVDDALYLMSASLYGKGDYYACLKKLQELFTRFPSSAFVPDARFTQGLAHYRLKDYAAADTTFRACERDYPDFHRKWALYYYAGESKAQQREYGAALFWYRRAARSSEDRRERGDALRRAGDALFQDSRYDSSLAVYRECLRVEERAKERLEVALRLGECLRELGRRQEALEWFQDWRPYAITEKREGDLLLRVHECMGLLGRSREAIAGYQDLVTRFPRTNVAYAAQFQIGYIYETQLGDLEAAGREYEKLRSGPPSQFSTQASRRSQGLTTLKQYRQELGADTTQAKARAAFLLAELYYFQLDDPDSAARQYRLVEEQFPKSRYAPKAAYARLWILTQNRGDTLAAMVLTDSIARRYRGSRYVESSLFLWKRWAGRVDERTALLDSLLAHPDTTASAERYEDDPLPGRELPVPARAPGDSLRAPERGPAPRGPLADSLLADSLLAAPRPGPGMLSGAAPDSARSPGARPEPEPPPPAAAIPDTAGLPTIGPLR